MIEKPPPVLSETKQVPEGLKGLGQRVEQRFKEKKWSCLITLDEAKQLGNFLVESVGEHLPHLFAKERTFSKRTMEGRLKRYGVTKEVCGFSDSGFYEIICATDKIIGGGFGFESDTQMKAFSDQLQEKLTADENPFKTLGEKWKNWDNNQRAFVFRSIAILESLYETIHLASLAISPAAETYFDDMSEMFSLNLSRRLLRGEHKAFSKAHHVQELGGDYQQARPLLPTTYNLMFERLILKLPEISPISS